jgi:two-component system, NarL family, response regulator DesR
MQVATTTLIADTDERFRTSVRKLIEGPVEVVGEAADDESAIALARALEPDVILIDLDLPRAGGIETARMIKDDQPGIRVVLMTAHGEEAYLDATGKSGADAILPKKNARTEASAVLRRVASGVLRARERPQVRHRRFRARGRG